MNQDGSPAGVDKTRDAHIGVEVGVHLQIQFQGLKEISKTTLVGLERGLYLIVRTPPVPGTWTKLNKENHTIVRYLYKGTVYGFKCTLLAVMNEPFPLLFLSYPSDIETINLRKQERVECVIPAVARIAGSPCKGAVLDISQSGCSFAFNVQSGGSPPVTPGDEIVLVIRLAGSAGERELSAKVMNVRKTGDRVITGNFFTDADDAAMTAVEEYVSCLSEFAAIGQG